MIATSANDHTPAGQPTASVPPEVPLPHPATDPNTTLAPYGPGEISS